MSTARTVAKNTMSLFLAEVISKAASIVYFAVLARYIQVEGVGQVSAGQAVVYSLIVLVSFGMDQLLVREMSADKSRVPSYVSTVVLLRLALVVVFTGALLFLVHRLGYTRELATITYLYAANAVLRVFSDIALDVFRAHEQMEYNLVVRVTRDIANVVLSLVAILMGAGIVVIVAVSVVASVLELVVAWALLRRRYGLPRLQWRPELSRRLMVAALPFLLVTGIYPAVQQQLNTIVLSATANSTDLGRFAAANTIVGLLLLVPSMFMQAMYPVFARFSAQVSTAPEERLRLAYRKSFGYLFLFGVVVSVGTYMTADRIIPMVLGDSFAKAAPAMHILAWIPMVSYVGYCNGSFLTAVGKERLFMVTEGGFAVIYGLLALTLTPRYGYLGASWAMLGPTIVGFGFYTVWCHRLLGLALPWRMAAASLVSVAAMALVVRWALASGVHVLAVAILIAPPAYGLGLFVLRGITGEDVALLRHALKLA